MILQWFIRLNITNDAFISTTSYTKNNEQKSRLCCNFLIFVYSLH